MRNVPDKNLESMDNIMNKDNQMTNFYNINNKENDSELANNFDQNFATNSFMKSFCAEDTLQTRNVSTISGRPEFKETAQLGTHMNNTHNYQDRNSINKQ